MDESNNLNENQLIAVHMVAAGHTGREIAEKLEITEETVSRWKQRPEFQASVNSLLKDAHGVVINRLRDMVCSSLDVIQEALENDQLPIKPRLEAAFKILQMTSLDKTLCEPIGSDNPTVVSKRIEMERYLENANTF